MQKCHGVFITPEMQSIIYQMQKIHEAAEARSNIPDSWGYTAAELYPDFWDYTAAELEELRNLRQAYNAAKAAAGL